MLLRRSTMARRPWATARRLGAATETAAAVASEAKPRACGRIDARFGRDEQTAGGKAEGGPQAAFEGRRNIPEYNRMVLSAQGELAAAEVRSDAMSGWRASASAACETAMTGGVTPCCALPKLARKPPPVV